MPLQKSHLTAAETSRIDTLRLAGKEPLEVLALLNRSRQIRNVAPLSRTSLYDYCSGKTHRRDHPEKRGRKAVGMRSLKVYNDARKELQKSSRNEYLVTWEDIADAGAKALRKKKLLKRNQAGLSPDWLRRRLRSEIGVGRRPAAAEAPRQKSQTEVPHSQRARRHALADSCVPFPKNIKRQPP
jgi:hypothetical protein